MICKISSQDYALKNGNTGFTAEAEMVSKKFNPGKSPWNFRLRTDYWKKRIEGREYSWVEFTLGYPRRGDSSRRIRVPYRGARVMSVRSEEWDNRLEEVYAIPTS